MTGALFSNSLDLLKVLRHGGPALCNIAVTNSCNAKCDFCNFAYDKERTGPLRWIDADQFDRALVILRQRDIRYVSFFGGEPLLHPRLADMIAMAVARGMGPALITNGWLLPRQLDRLASAGLKTIYISIDAATTAEHESNRGLTGVCERIRSATRRMPRFDIIPIAQVTINKLILDYRALVRFLRDLGFESVAFSYPQQVKLGSTTLAWSEDSKLVNFTPAELLQAFEAVDEIRGIFHVTNPRASVEDMRRHLRGERESFVCYGGFKSFFMDWNYDVWRCDAWATPMCRVWDFGETTLIRDGCTACIADCYRDSSVMLHFAVSLGDAIDHFAEGRLLQGIRSVTDRRNLTAMGAVLENAGVFRRLAKVGQASACEPA